MISELGLQVVFTLVREIYIYIFLICFVYFVTLISFNPYQTRWSHIRWFMPSLCFHLSTISTLLHLFTTYFNSFVYLTFFNVFRYLCFSFSHRFQSFPVCTSFRSLFYCCFILIPLIFYVDLVSSVYLSYWQSFFLA